MLKFRQLHFNNFTEKENYAISLARRKYKFFKVNNPGICIVSLGCWKMWGVWTQEGQTMQQWGLLRISEKRNERI